MIEFVSAPPAEDYEADQPTTPTYVYKYKQSGEYSSSSEEERPPRTEACSAPRLATAGFPSSIPPTSPMSR